MSTPIVPHEKRCRVCGAIKLITEFYPNKTYRDGHLSQCKSCSKAAARAYNLAHQEKCRERYVAWAKANKDRVREQHKAWASQNQEKVKLIKKRWRESEKGIAYQKQRQKEISGSPQRKAASLKYYASNKDRYRTYVRNRRARIRGADGSHSKEDMAFLLAAQGGKCAICLCRLGDNYHGDHIKPLALGRSNDRHNIQLLCPTCNKRKGAKDPITFAHENGRLL